MDLLQGDPYAQSPGTPRPGPTQDPFLARAQAGYPGGPPREPFHPPGAGTPGQSPTDPYGPPRPQTPVDPYSQPPGTPRPGTAADPFSQVSLRDCFGNCT